MAENRNQEVVVKEDKVQKNKKKDVQAPHEEVVQQNVFKNIPDLTEEEIDKLPRVSVILRKIQYKKSIGYEYEVRFNELLKIKNKKPLTETKYNLLKLKLGLDLKKAEDTLRVPCRLVTGFRKDDSVYHQIELILSPGIFETDFWFYKDELELLELTIPDVHFVTRPEKIGTKDFTYEE